MLKIQRFFEQKTGTVVIVFTVLLCAVFILHTLRLWGGYGVGQVGEARSVEQVRSFNNQSARAFDTSQIVSRNLFSSPPALAQASSAVVASATALRLEAIFESRDHSQSKAIVSNNGQPGKTFAEGAEISPGIRLEKIERQQLLINNRGRREALRFPQHETKTAIASNAGTGVGSLSGTGSITSDVTSSDSHELSELEFSQLIAELPPEEQQKVSGLASNRDLGKLINAVSENDKVKLVTQRLEQLRRKSRNQ